MGPAFGISAFLDFFIWPVQWGVELLRDGCRLDEHRNRYSADSQSHLLNCELGQAQFSSEVQREVSNFVSPDMVSAVLAMSSTHDSLLRVLGHS